MNIKITKEVYIFSLVVNGEVKEMHKMRYMGLSNKWLHFLNVLTLENHLVPVEQFPEHEIKGREISIKFLYQ